MKNKKLLILFSVLCGLTLVIVLTSVIFSVQQIESYCANADDAALEKKVVEKCGIEKGKSIFLLNEKKVIKHVESMVPEIEVLNIERKFPNCVYINYTKLFDYLEIARGNSYYILSKGGKVLKANEQPTDKRSIIRLKLKKDADLNLTPGKYYTDDNRELKLLIEIFSSCTVLGYNEDIVEMFDFIDISDSGYIFFKTARGVYLEVDGRNNLADKLIRAVTMYVGNPDNPDDGINRQTGTIRVWDSTGAANASYTPTDRYEQIIGSSN